MKKRQTTLDDFVKVVKFKVIRSIKHGWQSLDAFKEDWQYQKTHKDQKANQIYARMVKLFNIEHNTLTNIAGRDADGAKQLGKFLATLTKGNSTNLVYVHKKTATYKKSGKTFNSKSWFYITFEELEKLFAIDGTEENNDPFIVSKQSTYYSEAQHKLIDKYIFGYRKERKTYEKSEKFYAAKQKLKEEHMQEVINKKLAAGEQLTPDELEALSSKIINNIEI